MSNLYVTEPPTHGKVLISTNRGELEIELWSKETPTACRNFVQLCLEGYYIDTIFHRLVHDFVIQGGDPTGTGTGGQSVFDEPFKDEFHSRLKFNRRGLLGMANKGKDDNGSQFFLTLGPAPELQGTNTLFGRVVGDTLYNLTKMGGSELETGTDRPLYPPKINKTEVLVNPFSDIVPRTTAVELGRRRAEQHKANAPIAKVGKKNKKLLSFADEEEGGDGETDTVTFKSKAKSSHDLLDDARLARTKPASKSVPRKRRLTLEEDGPNSTRPLLVAAGLLPSSPRGTDVARVTSRSSTPDAKESKKTASPPPSVIQAEIDALKASLKRARPNPDRGPDQEYSSKTTTATATTKKESHVDRQRRLYAAKARIGGLANRNKARLGGKAGERTDEEEEDVLRALSQFRQKLAEATAGRTGLQAQEDPSHLVGKGGWRDDDENDDDEEEVCHLHAVPGCMSCFDRIGERNDRDDNDDDAWFAHRLVFAADGPGKDARFKRRAEETLEVIDPREKAGQIALAARQAKRASDERRGRKSAGGAGGVAGSAHLGRDRDGHRARSGRHG